MILFCKESSFCAFVSKKTKNLVLFVLGSRSASLKQTMSQPELPSATNYVVRGSSVVSADKLTSIGYGRSSGRDFRRSGLSQNSSGIGHSSSDSPVNSQISGASTISALDRIPKWGEM